MDSRPAMRTALIGALVMAALLATGLWIGQRAPSPSTRLARAGSPTPEPLVPTMTGPPGTASPASVTSPLVQSSATLVAASSTAPASLAYPGLAAQASPGQAATAPAVQVTAAITATRQTPRPAGPISASATSPLAQASATLVAAPSTAPASVTAPTVQVTAATTATRQAPRPIRPIPGLPGYFASPRARVGVGLPTGEITGYAWEDGPPGWYLNWDVDSAPRQPAGTRFAQMVRLQGDAFYPELRVIKETAAANPGMLWLIGNEPDVVWQDNSPAEQYASTYGVLYAALKKADPSAQVAIGGVSQPTPLRLDYLERVLAAYRRQFAAEMPVDVWNVHAFILREEADSWGVRIPPGMPPDKGILYEIGDHANLTIFRQQIADFRRWMAGRGQRDKPLIVTEYGILMPNEYGFSPEQVAQFMTGTFNYFLTARDPAIGYPPDDDRLVQAFCWYSVADTAYPTSNLFDPKTRAVTDLGRRFRTFVAALE